jgi:uncharacterized protein YjbI with pentapeptide repeats
MSIDINYSENLIKVKDTCIDHSTFENVSLQNLVFNDVNLSGTRIINANMSNIEIEGAGLGGAYIHNIGPPLEGHPAYDPDARQAPLRFENCDFEGSTITDCNMTNVALKDCIIKGMTINGIAIDALIENFKHNNKQ